MNDTGNLQLQAYITLDDVSHTAFDRLLQSKDSTIRELEKSIANLICEVAKKAHESETDEPTLTNCVEDTTGEILDLTSQMNIGCFKAGLQTGSQMMLEMLNLL